MFAHTHTHTQISWCMCFFTKFKLHSKQSHRLWEQFNEQNVIPWTWTMSNHSLNMNLPSLNLSSALLLNKTSSTTRIQYYLHCLFNQCFNYLPFLSIYYYISTTNIRFIIGHIFHCYASLTLKMIPIVFCMDC